MRISYAFKAAAMLLAVVLLTACAGTLTRQKTDAPENDIYITFVTPLDNHPIWDVSKDGFMQAAKELSFGPSYVGPQRIDPAGMVNQIEIALASKVDGIITMPIAPEVMRPVLKKCADKGVPVVFVGSEDSQSKSLAFVGTDETELGKQGAQALMKIMGGKPIYAHIMQSTADASFAIKAREGYLEALKDYPGGFKMVLNEACDSDMMTAIKEYQNAFKEHPEINVAIGICGEAGPAAAIVVKDLGLQGKVKIIAIDDVPEILNYIQDDTIAGTMAQNYYKIGYVSAEVLYKYIKYGQKPQKYFYNAGSTFVTKENMETDQ